MADERLNEVVLTYEDHRLEKKHPELRNIVNEYRDGMMLFEVSNQKVWNAAANDYAALNEYFKTHRDKYTDWSEPPLPKGYVIYATSDSLIQEVNKFIAANPSIGNETRSVRYFAEHFPATSRSSAYCCLKGKNNVVDYAGFERNFLIFPANAVGNIFYNISGTRDRPARRSRRCTRRSDGGLSERTREKMG